MTEPAVTESGGGFTAGREIASEKNRRTPRRAKKALRNPWRACFYDPEGFRFEEEEEEIFIDEAAGRLCSGGLPPAPHAIRVMREDGSADVLHFRDEKICRKITDSRITLEIEGETVRRFAKTP